MNIIFMGNEALKLIQYLKHSKLYMYVRAYVCGFLPSDGRPFFRLFSSQDLPEHNITQLDEALSLEIIIHICLISF